jgi:Putative Ig domain
MRTFAALLRRLVSSRKEAKRAGLRPRLETLEDRVNPSMPSAPIAYTPDTTFHVTLPGSTEGYYIQVPSSYDSSNQTPTELLVWSHGCGGDNQFDVPDVASQPGGPTYITIGADEREGACWDVNNDTRFILDAIADVETHFNINAQQVVLGGYSSGGDLSYRVAFTNSTQIAGVLAENTTPFRDTGLTQDQALTAPFHFNIVQLAHLQDETYPIDTVRAETDAVQAAGAPGDGWASLQRIEVTGTHFDNPGAIVAGEAVPGTYADINTYLLPHLGDGWKSPLFFTADTPTPATVGVPYSYTFQATGAGTVVYSATNLPAWANLNPTTGVLSGTPPTAGDYTFEVDASNGGVVQTTVTLTVAPSNPAPPNPAPPNPAPGGGNPVVATPTGIGAFDSATGMWYLRNEANAGAPDAGQFQFGLSGWIAVTGDWNGTGETGIGVVDPTTGTWYLRNEASAGSADAGIFQFGLAGWKPVVGDWNGTGHTGIGMVDLSSGTWHLRDEASGGAADAGTFQFGLAGWTPIVGNWSGSGKTGIGVIDPTTSTWYLRNEASAGGADAGMFAYGLGGWKPLIGDWTGTGHDGIGVFDPSTVNWYLRNEVNAGAADAGMFPYGMGTWMPLSGHWSAATPADAVFSLLGR